MISLLVPDSQRSVWSVQSIPEARPWLSRGGWNKRGEGAKVPESKNEEAGINMGCGIFLEKTNTSTYITSSSDFLRNSSGAATPAPLCSYLPQGQKISKNILWYPQSSQKNVPDKIIPTFIFGQDLNSWRYQPLQEWIG